MSLAQKQAVIAGAVWLAVSVLFVVVFFSAGPVNFADEAHRTSRVLAAAVILPGYLINAVVLHKSRRGLKEGEVDERDEAVARMASEVTLTIVAAAVFVAAIALFEVYRGIGVVPVGWLYFMAYGVFCLISLVHPIVRLVADLGGKVDG